MPPRRGLIVETKEQKSKGQPDFTVGKQKFKSDLIPVTLLIACYFAAEQAAIEAIETELAALEQQLDELKEEHGGEGGLLEEGVDEKGKISKKAVATRLKEIGSDPEFTDERNALEMYADGIDTLANRKTELNSAEKALNVAIAIKYGELTEAEIKSMDINEKWLLQLAVDVQSELDRLSHALTGRIRQLTDRYDRTLPQMTKEVQTIAARVDQHLRNMGALWN